MVAKAIAMTNTETTATLAMMRFFKASSNLLTLTAERSFAVEVRMPSWDPRPSAPWLVSATAMRLE